MSFEDKVVIVTGSSSGIGAATAIHFAKQSAKVVLIGRNEAKLDGVAKECLNAKGIKPLIIRSDVTIDSDLEYIVEKTIKNFGKIDILVNNAGMGAKATVAEGIESYDKVMATNVRSVYKLTGLAIPHLIKTKGNIINISSIASSRATPIMAAYCMSKAALDMFTRCVAKELGPHGVRVNSVNPGPVLTDFPDVAGIDGKTFFNRLAEESPLKKIAQVDECSELIGFLAGDKAISITGSIYILDNGLSA